MHAANLSLTTPATIPLHYRLPNAPPLFVGRANEADRLAEMITRAPLTVVWGLGGIGKTSLALHVLNARFAHEVGRTVSIGLRPGDPPEQILVEMMRAIAAMQGQRKLDWAYALSDRDALLETVLDAAESLGAWVLVDDLHHASPEVVSDVLGKVARYARRARFICTSRVDPTLPELVGQILRLDGMQREELEDLAHHADPRLDAREIARVAEVSAGSPWQLRQVLAGMDPHATSFADALLQGVEASARAFIEALVVLELPLRSETLDSAEILPSRPQLDDLERRGIIERTPTGVRLHDVARGVLAPRVDVRARGAQLAPIMVATRDATAAVEAFRLHLAGGRVDEAADVFDARADALFAAGFAPRLWELLRQTRHVRFQHARLRCAVELGDPSVLAAIEQPDEPTPLDRFLWAVSLYLRGRLREVSAVASEVRTIATAAIGFHPRAGELAFEAGILEALCIGECGHIDEALAVVDALPVEGADRTARREVDRARWKIHQGKCDEALRILDNVVTLRVDVRPGMARELRTELIVCYAYLGRRYAIEAALASLGLRIPTGASDLFADRQGLLAQATFEVFAGRLRDAEQHLRAIKPLMQQTSYLRAFHMLVENERRIAAGELDDIDAEIRKVRVEAFACGQVSNYQWSIYHAYRVATLCGQSSVALPPDSERLASTPYWVPIHALVARRHALLHGQPAGEIRPYSEACIHARFQHDLLRTTELMLERDFEGAARVARSASALAREHGLAVHEIEADLVVCDALIAMGDHDALVLQVGELEPKTRAVESARFRGELRFRALVAGSDLSPATLESFALAANAAPMAARRARALLGEDVPLDRVDTMVVESVRARGGVKAIRALADAPARLGWGIDVDTKRVWLPGDRVVDLSSKALLFRVLLTIAGHGGSATKEQLVRGAWELRDYHPMRDDKRLQVAVRKLRILIEDDPAHAARVVTTDDGYAFGRVEPMRILGR